MAELYSFFNSKDHDRKYNAKRWADYFAPLFKSGVFNGDLQVTANDNMTVTIGTGYAWIDGYAYHLTEPITVDLETASGNMNRIDNIKIRLDLTNRWIKHAEDTGNYHSEAAVPKDPEITATVHDLIIARVSVAAGTTAITQDMITDTRMDSTVCGWVCGAVDQIKFEQITAQFNAFFAKYQSDIQAEYAEYLTNIASLETQAQTQCDQMSENIQEEYTGYLANIASLETQAQTRYDQMSESFTEYENQQKADFETWLESVKDVLDGNAAGNLLLLIEQKMQKVTLGIVNDKVCLDIEEGLQLALAGFTAKDYHFSDDQKTITETDAQGNTKTTTFVSDTLIEEEYLFTNGNRYKKSTAFNGSDISERIEKING